MSINFESALMSFMAPTRIIWRAGFNAHGLWRRSVGGSAGRCCRRSCCSQSQLLLLGLAGLHGVPLFDLLVELLVILLHVLLQVRRQLVHAAQDLACLFIKLLCKRVGY